MFGTSTVILDSRRDAFDRLTTEASATSVRTHIAAMNFRHAVGLGAAISELQQQQTETIFIHALDVDDSKLIEALKQLPLHKVPTQFVLYSAYRNLTEKLALQLELCFRATIHILPGDI